MTTKTSYNPTQPIRTFIIHGQPYSKANSRRLVYVKGKPLFIKSKSALAYEQTALFQLQTIIKENNWQELTKPLEISADIYYPDRRQDLDASLVFDILQKAGLIHNDRQLQRIHLNRNIDKDKPRTEINIWHLH